MHNDDLTLRMQLPPDKLAAATAAIRKMHVAAHELAALGCDIETVEYDGSVRVNVDLTGMLDRIVADATITDAA